MKNIIIILTIVICGLETISAQEIRNDIRYIEVTGSAEMEVAPDEIRFQIGIEEYWKEEFEKGKKREDYITLIPLEQIEKNLMSALKEIGIKKEQIIIKEIGQNWNRPGKYFKKNKTFELILTDFEIINQLLLKVKVRGVNAMKITQLKHQNITEFRQQVKIEAMKAAKKKATYLLKSVDEELGKVLSVTELKNNSKYWKPTNSFSNFRVSSRNADDKNDTFRKIKLKYEIQIRFEIK